MNIDVSDSRALRLDHTLLALADPTRRAIVQRLARSATGEARVTEIAAPFAISLNSVSKHIRVLERARLLRRRNVGREHFLSFDPRPLEEAAAWMATQRAVWTARLDALEAALRADDPKSTAGAADAPPMRPPAAAPRRRSTR